MTREAQYLRRDFPPPRRELYGDALLHYFHSNSGEYLGSEIVLDGHITLVWLHAERSVEFCSCLDCLRAAAPAQDDADEDTTALELLLLERLSALPEEDRMDTAKKLFRNVLVRLENEEEGKEP